MSEEVTSNKLNRTAYFQTNWKAFTLGPSGFDNFMLRAKLLQPLNKKPTTTGVLYTKNHIHKLIFYMF